MVVAKFGGSSLSDAEGFRRVADIVRKNNIPVVIVSAPGGKPKVTDLLISAFDEWESSGKCDGEYFDAVCNRFRAIANAFDINIDSRLIAIKAAINAGSGYDYAVSRGEYLSALILAAILGYNFVDAKECVKLTLEGKIDFNSIKAHSGVIQAPCVIPGFYGKLPNGEVKLLPRGGSDISGAAISAAIGGEYPLSADYQKFTDVDGIFNGHGGVIDSLSYDEAELLCYFGATVMQYESLPILKKAGIKLTVKSTFSDSIGTTVGEKRYNGYAFSSKKMFLGGSVAAKYEQEILNEGLKIPYKVTLLNKSKILIDDCGFSPLALKRILCYNDIEEVTVTAAIGDVPSCFAPGKLIFEGDVGKIYIQKSGQLI
ncbi:MAG: hypothetical protein J1F36_04460 [Clostridiales bacterium]|nr:hypothetical protein [Clostridiales bacterium]